jgi:hypothetical protein
VGVLRIEIGVGYESGAAGARRPPAISPGGEIYLTIQTAHRPCHPSPQPPSTPLSTSPPTLLPPPAPSSQPWTLQPSPSSTAWLSSCGTLPQGAGGAKVPIRGARWRRIVAMVAKVGFGMLRLCRIPSQMD